MEASEQFGFWVLAAFGGKRREDMGVSDVGKQAMREHTCSCCCCVRFGPSGDVHHLRHTILLRLNQNALNCN